MDRPASEPRVTDTSPEARRLQLEVLRAMSPARKARLVEDAKAAARAARDRASFNLVHLTSGVKVDIFVKGISAFDQAELDRRLEVRVGDTPARDTYVKSAEDTVLRKLLWFRLGGDVSDRQREDVLGIVSMQEDRLDRADLALWADRLGLRDLLARVLRVA